MIYIKAQKRGGDCSLCVAGVMEVSFIMCRPCGAHAFSSECAAELCNRTKLQAGDIHDLGQSSSIVQWKSSLLQHSQEYSSMHCSLPGSRLQEVQHVILSMTSTGMNIYLSCVIW